MERRPLRLHDYDAVLREVANLRATGYDRVGKWGLAEVCNHLSLAFEMALDGFPSLMPWPMRVGARWFALGAILRHKVFRMRMAAPSYLLPSDSQDEEAAIARFQAVIARLKAHAGDLMPSPIFGQLSAVQSHEVHLWHCEHHFSFLLPRTATTV